MGRVFVDSFPIYKGNTKNNELNNNNSVNTSSSSSSSSSSSNRDKRNSVSRSSISSIYSSISIKNRNSFSSYFDSSVSPNSTATSTANSASNSYNNDKEYMEIDNYFTNYIQRHQSSLPSVFNEYDDDDEDDDEEEEEDEDINFTIQRECDDLIWHVHVLEDDEEQDDDEDEDAEGDEEQNDEDEEEEDEESSIVGNFIPTKNKILPNRIIYRCKKCYSDICNSSLIISKDFWGNNGEAYFVKNVINVYEDSNEILKNMRTGQYIVKDIICIQCNLIIGWKYIKSIENSQNYKIGKFVIEKNLLKNYQITNRISR